MSDKLGAVNQVSAEASVDAAVAFGRAGTLMALGEELSKIDNATYTKHFKDRIAAALANIGDLNKQIVTLEPQGVAAWRQALDANLAAIDAMQVELVGALKDARTKRDFIAVGLTAASILLAGWGGWYVFSKRKKQLFK